MRRAEAGRARRCSQAKGGGRDSERSRRMTLPPGRPRIRHTGQSTSARAPRRLWGRGSLSRVGTTLLAHPHILNSVLCISHPHPHCHPAGGAPQIHHNQEATTEPAGGLSLELSAAETKSWSGDLTQVTRLPGDTAEWPGHPSPTPRPPRRPRSEPWGSCLWTQLQEHWSHATTTRRQL